MTELMRIHLLDAGLPLCGFTRLPPIQWPPGHCWATVDDDEARENAMACHACLHVLRNRAPKASGEHRVQIARQGESVLLSISDGQQQASAWLAPDGARRVAKALTEQVDRLEAERADDPNEGS